MDEVVHADGADERRDAHGVERQVRIQVEEQRDDVRGREGRRGHRVAQHAQVAHGEPVYWRAMPIDVPARVIANRRLSDDYNVLTLEAPPIAASALPGQFVMLKPGSALAAIGGASSVRT